tara:strand:- start:1716 stop:1880 length:165 start_codon:yes stop_codon:yes gene_type:complete
MIDNAKKGTSEFHAISTFGILLSVNKFGLNAVVKQMILHFVAYSTSAESLNNSS